ncbi:MAG: TetR/AcrR family transcriptional regulator [Acidimicrobiia bacterium]|nr:TetR/AcrR family transcriptional regulator [Acidimicrobiia bacterium]MDH5236310.1 TetR/AcrR family transcriptional regulator [Acidimicrobiia bacterium]
MTTKSDLTRSRLLEAGERLFAERGVENTTVADITRAAGQRNGAAIHYHFGGRDGLLDAIIERHDRELNQLRHARLEQLEQSGPVSAREMIELIVETMATRLDTGSGRAFLQIQGHRSAATGGALSRPSLAMAAIRSQLQPLLPTAGRELDAERAELVATMVIGRLARRAREEAAGTPSPTRATVVDALVDAATAVLTAAPPPTIPHQGSPT